MADFNVKVKNAENSAGFMGASQGFSATPVQQTVTPTSSVADRSASTQGKANFVGGLGNLFVASVNAADDIIKSDINEQATQATDQVFDEFGVSDATVFGEDVSVERPPAEIERAAENLRRLSNANARGGLSDDAYWTRMNSISRQLRAKYPGHRDYIDQKISSIAGGNPANQLVRSMLSSADSARTNANSLENKRLAFQEDLTKAGLYRPDRHQNMSYHELLQDAAPLYAERESIRMAKERFDALQAQGEVTDELATKNARQIVNHQLKTMMTDLTSPMGKTYSDFMSKIRDIQNSPNPSADDIGQIRTQFNTLKQAFLSQTRLALLENYPSLKGSEMQDMLNNGVEQFKMIEDGLANKDVGLLYEAVNSLEAAKTQDDMSLYKSSEAIRRTATAKRLLGEQATQLLLSADPLLQSAVQKDLFAKSLHNMYGGDNVLIDEVNYHASRGSNTKEMLNALVDSNIQILNSPKSSADARKRAVQIMYDDKNIELLSRVPKEQQAALFARLVNPQVVQQLRNDPVLLQQHNAWSKAAFARVFRGKANDLTEAMRVVKDAKVIGSITFDPKSFSFSAPSPVGGVQTEDVVGLNDTIRDVSKVASDFNSILATIKPVLQASNEDPVAFLNTYFENLNINPTDMKLNVSGRDFSSLNDLVSSVSNQNFVPQSGRLSTNVDDRRGQIETKGIIEQNQAYMSFYNEALNAYRERVPADQFILLEDIILNAADNYARKKLGVELAPRSPKNNPLQSSIDALEDAEDDLKQERLSNL